MGYNILSVDELGKTRLELAGLLKSVNVNVVSAKDEVEAVNVLHNKDISFNAIIWSINSFDLSEFDAIKRIKDKEAYKHIPVMIISKYADKRYIIKAIECGAIEYIAKPFDIDTIINKVRRILSIAETITAKKEEEDIVSFTFTEMLNKELKGATRGKYPVSVILATVTSEKNDLINQGNMNDIIGIISKVVKSKLRETDTTFRYGLGNLMILLPFADLSGVKVVEQKVQSIFKTHSAIQEKNKGYELITACATFPEEGKVKEQLLERLEKNLSQNMKNRM